jgi:hypothetical protein
MAIDIESEDLIPFPEAPAAFPGRKPCLQTLHRWRTIGVRGRVLETILIGGSRYTSREAIRRFCSEAPSTRRNGQVSPQDRSRLATAAMAVLSDMGISRSSAAP